MALLYVAKRNSDALSTQAAALGKSWSEVTASARGPYAVEPNRCWDDAFFDLSEAVLQEYGSNCASVVNMLKPKKGTLFSFTSRSIDVTDAAELLDLVGAELRRLAAGYLRREQAGHTLQPTALVNEAYLKLIDSTVIRSRPTSNSSTRR